MARPSRAVLTLLTMAALSAPALAQWSPDPAVNNAVFAGAEDQSPAVAVSDGAGGVIVVWRTTASGVFGLRAQRIDAVGVVRWPAGGVTLVTSTVAGPATLLRPPFAAIADGNGGVIAAWRDNRTDVGDVYARRVDQTGAVQWTAEGVAVGVAADLQTRPVLASDGAGGAIVAWEDRRNGPANNDVYAQRVTAAGTVSWAANGVAVCSAAADQLLPAIVADGSGGALLAWADGRAAAQEIFAQRLSSSGLPLWAPDGVALTAVSGIQTRPSLAGDGAGGAIVAWEDDRNGADNDIYARRIDAAGAPQWTADGVGVAAAANATFPVVVSDNGGGAIVVWTDERNGSTDVFAQRLSGAGVSQWAANGVTVTAAAAGQFFPTVVADGAGGVVIGWEDGRNGISDVFAQRLNASGSPLWSAGGRPVSTAAEGQGGVTVAPDGSGGGLFSWLDGRTLANGLDVYAAHVDGSGALPVTLERFAIE